MRGPDYQPQLFQPTMGLAHHATKRFLTLGREELLHLSEREEREITDRANATMQLLDDAEEAEERAEG